MSELTITLLRLGYLAVLWLFVFAAIGVLRKDIYGTRITARPTDRPAPRRNPVQNRRISSVAAQVRPATSPSIPPMNVLPSVARSATDKEARAPWTVRANTSQPWMSKPNQLP